MRVLDGRCHLDGLDRLVDIMDPDDIDPLLPTQGGDNGGGRIAVSGLAAQNLADEGLAGMAQEHRTAQLF